MSSLSFWFVYFTLDDIYRVTVPFILIIRRKTACTLTYQNCMPIVFFLMWDPIAGILFSGHLEPIFLHFIITLIYFNITRWSHLKKLIRTTPSSVPRRTADRRSLILPFDPSIQSFDTTKERNEVLYKSSLGFEPTSSSTI